MHIIRFLIGVLLGAHVSRPDQPPHIILIVADDLGWNDVSFHGSQQIPTPNIDYLAKNGVTLDNYYVLPVCTPTRSALMTGRYPIHIGMQSDTIYAPNAWGVGLNETFLPQYLKKQGYKTHAVGKWHLGFYAKEYTPTYRGFDTFYGLYLGKSDYWNHTATQSYWGLDLHENENTVYDQTGNYSTEVFTSEAERRIKSHNVSEPLFLYLSYQAVHSADIAGEALQAPLDWINKFKHIEHEQRRKYAAMVAYMDYGIGRTYQQLVAKEMIDNTVIVFTTDNGGPSDGFNRNWASNFPLRGVKATLYEGGVRAVGLIYSKLLEKPGRVSKDLMHVTDWLPTFMHIANGSFMKDTPLDGVNQWNTLQNMAPSPRNEVLLNIDSCTWLNAALRVGDWKVIQECLDGGEHWDGWYPPPGNATPSDEHQVDQLSVKCGEIPKNVTHCTNEHGYCLFNVKNDPCEFNDLSKENPEVLEEMLFKLEAYKASMVPARNNLTVDPLSDPKLHNGAWMPWITL